MGLSPTFLISGNLGADKINSLSVSSGIVDDIRQMAGDAKTTTTAKGTTKLETGIFGNTKAKTTTTATSNTTQYYDTYLTVDGKRYSYCGPENPYISVGDPITFIHSGDNMITCYNATSNKVEFDSLTRFAFGFEDIKVAFSIGVLFFIITIVCYTMGASGVGSFISILVFAIPAVYLVYSFMTANKAKAALNALADKFSSEQYSYIEALNKQIKEEKEKIEEA